VISGYSQRLNKSTGHTDDDYLISAIIPRDRFAQINFSDLQQVDPVEAIGSFTIRRSMSATKLLMPIEPFGSSDAPLLGNSRLISGSFSQ
jgi:hypothetical protein